MAKKGATFFLSFMSTLLFGLPYLELKLWQTKAATKVPENSKKGLFPAYPFPIPLPKLNETIYVVLARKNTSKYSLSIKRFRFLLFDEIVRLFLQF